MRKMMKRTLSAGLAAVLAMSSLTGCGGGKKEPKEQTHMLIWNQLHGNLHILSQQSIFSRLPCRNLQII